MEKDILQKLHNEEIKILDEIVRICNENSITYFLVGGTLLGAVRHNGFIPWDDDLDIAMPREHYEKFLKIAKDKLSERFMIDYHKTNKKYWLSFAKVRIKNTIYDEKITEGYDTQKGIWVDIFPLDNTEKENSLKLKVQWFFVKTLKKIADNKLYMKLETNKIKRIFRSVLAKITNMNFTIKSVNYFMQIFNDKENKYFVNFGSQYGIKKQTHLLEKYLPAAKMKFEGKEYNIPNDYNYVLTKIYGKDYMKLPPIEKRVTHNPQKIKFEDGDEINFETRQ